MKKIIPLLLIFLFTSCEKNENFEQSESTIIKNDFSLDENNPFLINLMNYDKPNATPQRPNTRPVFRYFYYNKQDHYYSLGGPYDPLYAKDKWYEFETREFYSINSVKDEDFYELYHTEIFRYYNPTLGVHALENMTGYYKETSLGYIFSEPMVGTSPLKVYYKKKGDSYLYTSSITEDLWIANNAPNVTLKGILGWVYTGRNDFDYIPDTKIIFENECYEYVSANLKFFVKEKLLNGGFVDKVLYYPMNMDIKEKSTIIIPKKYFICSAELTGSFGPNGIYSFYEKDIFAPFRIRFTSKWQQMSLIGDYSGGWVDLYRDNSDGYNFLFSINAFFPVGN